MNALIKNESTQAFLGDETVKTTDNSQWFDNQANVIDFVKPKERLEDFTVEELKEKLLETNQQITSWADLYKQTQNELFLEKLAKLNRFRCALQINILKKRRSGDDPAYSEVKQLKATQFVLHNKMQGEISSLRKQLARSEKANTGLLQQNELLRKGIQNQKQKTINVQQSTHRNIRIHNIFKELIKDEIGAARYLELISQADKIERKEHNQ